MDKKRAAIYAFFGLPFHQRINIAKEIDVFDESDLELSPTEATQIWSRYIVGGNSISRLINLMDVMHPGLEAEIIAKCEQKSPNKNDELAFIDDISKIFEFTEATKRSTSEGVFVVVDDAGHPLYVWDDTEESLLKSYGVSIRKNKYHQLAIFRKEQ